MTDLTRDQVLNADDCRPQAVEVPEWGGTIYVRQMSAAERDRLEAETFRPNGKHNLANLSARTVVLCACDAGGRRLFSDRDAEALGKKSAAAVSRVFKVVQQVNGLNAEAVEDAEKN
jgi:hypothetical protein